MFGVFPFLQIIPLFLQTEKKLIRDCQKGIKKAQYVLVKRYSPMLLSVCRRYARDEAMARDVLQETLIRIFENINRYEPRGSFEAWMRRIAVRRSLQWLDKSAWQHELQPVQMPEAQPEPPEIYSQLEAEEIMALLRTLPDGFRAVFNLYVVEGYTHSQIAALLGISESTSRSQLVRARKLLQEKLLILKKTSRYEVATVRK
ncbi:MAG TPA: sigma-70 family RNA polymerase sigma factor [Bacteroidetes bacterium]|nr:sigma-70 family RNA polymerase sigma factor [Bacteroidota bacterium]